MAKASFQLYLWFVTSDKIMLLAYFSDKHPNKKEFFCEKVTHLNNMPGSFPAVR